MHTGKELGAHLSR